MQAIVGAGVEPCESAAEALHSKITKLEIGLVNVGDLEFAARRRR